MGKFYVNTATLNQQSRALSEVSDSLLVTKGAVNGISSGMAGIGLSGIMSTMLALENKLSAYVTKTSNLSSTLASISMKYITAESEIMGIPVFLNPNFADAASTIMENTIDNQERVAYDNSVQSWLVSFLSGGDGSSDSQGVGVDLGISYEHEIGSFGYEDFDIDNPYFSQAETVHLFTAGVEDSVSFWEASGKAEGIFGSASGNVGFLNAEASAGVYAGLFTEDGKFAPGIGAEASASVSLFEASGDALLGNDYLGLYARGEVAVCQASAEASIDAGLYDENGVFNPSLGASLEAQALLASASGSAGARVLGTDVGVTGSVGVGLGATASVGLQDGVLSLELGAYVGVGGSVSLELDFSDTCDTIVSAWNDATEIVSDAGEWIADTASDAGEWIADTASDAGEWIADTASSAWDAITFWD